MTNASYHFIMICIYFDSNIYLIYHIWLKYATKV